MAATQAFAAKRREIGSIFYSYLKIATWTLPVVSTTVAFSATVLTTTLPVADVDVCTALKYCVELVVPTII